MLRKRRPCALCIESLEPRQLLSGGYIDTRFGTGGLATAAQSGFSFNATDTAVRSDGKVIVVGTATSNTTHATFIDVARYNAGGSLDTTFGTNGFSSSRVPGTAAAVALQSDNKIVVVGADQQQSEFKVVRFTANGDLDTSFNHTGVAITTFDSSGTNSANAADVAIQKDGKIVVAGSAYTGGFLSSNFDAAVVRYNTDGSVDTSFGSSGVADIGLGDREYGEALTIDYAGTSSNNPDFGKIVVVGAAENTQGTTSNFLIARLQTNGNLDKTFHHTGKFSSTFVSEYTFSDARGVVVQASNKIVIVGSVGPTLTSSDNFGIIRLNPDGSGDSTFGPSNGQTEVDFGGNDAAHSVIVSQSGDLLVGGATASRVGIVALKSNGLIDKSFGPNGTGRVTTAGSGNIYTGGMALAPGGTFIVAGGDNAAAERYYDRASYTAEIFTNVANAFEQGKVPAVFIIAVTPNTSATTRVFYTLSGTATSPFTFLRSQVDYSGVTPVPPPSIGGSNSGSGGISHSSLNTGYVDIPAGTGFVELVLTPNDDSRPEADESIIVTLAADPGYDINPVAPSASAVIHDNDSPTGTGTTLTDTADAYVQDGASAGTNFGSSSQLEVKEGGSGVNRQTYLKFDLSSVSSVNSVKLNLFGELSNTDATNILTQLFSVADTSWTESGINFNNKPAVGTSVLASATITNTTPSMYTFDVTSYVKAQLAAGNKTVSFVLKNPSSSSPFVIFNSKEAGSNAPTLTVS